MASIAFVTAAIFRHNSIFYNENTVTKQVPCEGALVVGIEYFNPHIQCEGRQDGYYGVRDANEAQADSIKTIHVKVGSQHYYIAINNSDDESLFVNACNACCGATPDISTGVVIATPVAEQTMTPNAEGEATMTFGIPTNSFGRNILIAALTYNGGQTVGATPNPAGYADADAVAAWLTTNASAIGTWTATTAGTQSYITLVSSTTDSVNLDLNLAEGVYCLNLPAVAATIAQVVIKDNADVDQVIEIPSTTFSEANRQGVLNVLDSVLLGDLELVEIGSGDWRISYTGQQKLVAVQSEDGTTTNVAFTAGACA